MLAEVLSIGNEVISGRILDTNAQWLSQRLEELGYRVRFHAAVGDDLDDLIGAFRRAAGRVDLVVATGGLGPTEDDLTRDALAAAFGLPLEVNTEALDQIRALFARRQRMMPSRNELQARFPRGARAVRNPNGTAPGIELDVLRSDLSRLPTAGDGDPPRELPADRARCRIICLPGVPAEIAEMWNDSVARRLMEHNASGLRIVHKQIKCFGAGESQIEAMLPEGFVRQTDPRVGINASATTIIFRISAQAPTVEECRAKIGPAVETLYARLGELVFGEDDDELETVVCRLLAERRQTLGVIDCGSGGLVGERLGAAAGGAGVLRGSCAPATADALAHIAERFGLSANVTGTSASRGAAGSSDSPGPSAVAAALAQAARLLWSCDWGLAVSPLPPEGPSASPPRPFAVAAADASGVKVKELPYAGHPAWLRAWISKQALNTLRLALLRR